MRRVQLDEALDDAARIRPTVHVIAQRDERVASAQADGFEERVESAQAAVDVADG